MSWFSTDLVDVNLVEDRTPGEDGSTAPVSEQNPLAGVDGTVVLVIGGEDDVIGLTGNTYFPIEMMKHSSWDNFENGFLLIGNRTRMKPWRLLSGTSSVPV